MVLGKGMDYVATKPLPLVFTPPPLHRQAPEEIDDSSWALLLPESHDFSAMSNYMPGEEQHTIAEHAKPQEIEPVHGRSAGYDQFLTGSAWLKKTPKPYSEKTTNNGSGEEQLGQKLLNPPSSNYSKTQDLASALMDKTPSSSSPSFVGYLGEDGNGGESTKLTKEERALRRRAFHKIHTRRSRAKLNDKMEHLRQVLPSPPTGICVKSKAQILDWAIACATAQKLSASQDLSSDGDKRTDNFPRSP